MKIRLLLSAPGQGEPTALRAAVVDAGRAGAAEGWLLVPGATDGLPHTLALGGDPRSFQVMLDITGGELEDLLPRLDALRGVLALAGPRSAALAGTEHVIAPGDAPFQFVVVLARLPTLSRDAFHAYWLENHPRVVRPGGGGRGYRQFHAEPEATTVVCARIGLSSLGFEGTASGYVPDVTAFRSALGDSARLAPILADERRFIDHSRTAVGLYERVAPA